MRIGKGKKLKAVGIVIVLLATFLGGIAHAYKSGEKLKGDGSYFFHNPNDYIKYLKSIWEKHPGDIDSDKIPNDIEEKYGLNMFESNLNKK